MDSKHDWTKVAGSMEEIPFGDNQMALLDANGRTICMVRTAGGLKACAPRCPHAGGNICGGYLDAKDRIVCPVHHYRFSLDTGRDASGEGYFLKTYPVKVTNEGVLVAIDQVK